MKKLYFLSPLILQKLIWIPTRFILSFFGRLEIRGMENLSGLHGGVIFACNHTSEMDPFMIPGSLPFFSRFSPIFYTSRESKFYESSGWRKHFYGGYFFKAWGSYPVHTGLHDYEKSLSYQIKILNDGGGLCYFPEGKITPDGSIQPAKGGVAFLAHRTGKPIVPVRFDGLYKIGLSSLFLRRRHLRISFGKPFYTVDHESNDLGAEVPLEEFKRCANEVMEKVKALV